MKPKKNPKVDLNRNSSLYFVIGLNIVLFLTWRAMEMKTYEQPEHLSIVQNIAEDITEDIPITKTLNLPPPPPPPAAPDVIQVVEDEEEIKETIVISSESDQETEISEFVEVDDVATEDEVEEIYVPFSVIEEAPIFPGCEGLDKSERAACFNKKMQEHINKNFKYPQIPLDMGIQGRVFVTFVIDRNGDIVKIQKRGPDKNLENEAVRIIKLLPKMKPGRQRDKNVNVPYSIPVNFIIRNG
ncbi:energy transducer TonB [Spongiivirga citrea]|uniref:TonB family protein n=1 Tax=Spongiivirga citrea TaxID=1481457 RepID=A0A6M0CG28_9FLAO|nr:energy transducer TonB [Spongiivirga citrea]NER16818.1 TonB family protein [Spongiivirga citrea]